MVYWRRNQRPQSCANPQLQARALVAAGAAAVAVAIEEAQKPRLLFTECGAVTLPHWVVMGVSKTRYQLQTLQDTALSQDYRILPKIRANFSA